MKIISDYSDIWHNLDCLKVAYIDAMVLNTKINPHNIKYHLAAIVRALQGDEEVKNMDLTITERKTNIHDIEISALKNVNEQLRNELNELKREFRGPCMNSCIVSEDKSEGGGG